MEEKEPPRRDRRLIIAIVALVVVIGGAAIAYNALVGRAGDGGGLATSSVGTSADTAASAQSGTNATEPGSEEGGTDSGVAFPTVRGSRSAAPELSIVDEDGKSVSLSGLDDKPKVVIFWASWCHYCQQELGSVDELYATYGDRVDFIAVDCIGSNGETEQLGRDYKEKAGLTFPIYFDDAAQTTARTYEVYSFPTTYFIDGDGGLIGYYPGYVQPSTFTSILDSMLAE